MAITYPKESESVDAVAGSKPLPMKNAKGVIDLTNVSDTNESEDIQKAIAASLQYSQTHDTPGILGGQVSREEQDISRFVERYTPRYHSSPKIRTPLKVAVIILKFE